MEKEDLTELVEAWLEKVPKEKAIALSQEFYREHLKLSNAQYEALLNREPSEEEAQAFYMYILNHMKA